MAITYTWVDAAQTGLYYVDDSTTPNTELQIPVDSENRHYQDYLSWVADGNNAVDFSVTSYPGYEDLATAKATCLARKATELTQFVKEGNYTFNFFRSLADSSFTLPAGTGTKFADAYALYDTFETAINSETDIDKIYASTIDYEADTYNIPS
jgi:hypothetical protein